MLLWLICSVVVTYWGARIIESSSHRKAWFILFLLVEIGSLCVLKLQNFVVNNFNAVLHITDTPQALQPLSIVAPLGVSFFMLQFISYLVDVYKEKNPATHDFLLFAVYGTFFPQVLSGPINRWAQLKDEFIGKKSWDWDRILPALERIAWGFFKKLVIAERLNIIVSAAFTSYQDHSGFNSLIGALACTLQLYADFSGYSDIAFGVAQVFDIHIIDNFSAPYFSTSVQEFWRRWHISLSSWLKDYVYIPLGGSRCSKLRRYINLMLTFLVSGIWHGAGWNYIWWGLLHGLSQMIGSLTQPVRQGFATKLHLYKNNQNCALLSVFQTIGTFIIVMLLWVLFFAPTATDGFRMIAKIFQLGQYQLSSDLMYLYGSYTPIIWLLLFVSLVVMALGDFLAKQNGNILIGFHKLPWLIQLFALWFIIGAITLSLNLSTTEFIYMKF